MSPRSVETSRRYSYGRSISANLWPRSVCSSQLLAVIPWDQQTNQLLDSQAARRSSYLHLGRWIGEAERLWHQHGHHRRTLLQQLDYWGQLTAQLPPPPLRVVYAASGTLPAVAILRDREAICEHKLYWAAVAGGSEAHYLEAVLNSECARAAAAHLQSRGQWGARDFDKVMFELPIPRFDPANPLHRRLAQAAATRGTGRSDDAAEGT